jgi:hypothetical protein
MKEEKGIRGCTVGDNPTVMLSKNKIKNKRQCK